MDKEQLEEMLERHEERDLQSTCNKLATDCISRQEAIECLNGEMKLSSFENAQIVQDYLVRAVEKLYDLPSAQRTGRWIVKKDSQGCMFGECTCCGMKQYAGRTDYCPNCGAYMKEES